MSKFRKGLMKRVMAVILSGAMIMSNMTVYAAEAGYDAANGYVETAADEKSDAAETDVEETKISEEASAAADTQAESAMEAETEKTDESESTQETTTEETESTDSETETKKTDESETAVDSETAETETVEEETETESTEEETTEEETETEGAEEETTEEAEDNKELAEGSLDISGGLTAGTEYGDDIVSITVLGDFDHKTGSDTIDGVEYKEYVAGKANPQNDADKNMSDSLLIPTKGAAFVIRPVKAAKLTVLVRGDGSKTWYFVKDDGSGGSRLATGLTKPSACTFSVDAGATYYFYAAGSKVNVCGMSWKEKNPNRIAWSEIAAPVISDVSLDSTDASKINVTVDAVIGDEGADKVEVLMYDEEGKEAASAYSTSEKKQTVLPLSPKASGTYTFKAVTSRDDEQEEKESETKELEFVLPLTAPVMKSAVNLGSGNVEVTWEEVPGAEYYVLEITGPEEIAPIETETIGKIVKGLTVGQTYTFTVYAVRGEEKTAKSDAISCTVKEEEEHKWNFIAYGNGTSKWNDMSYEEIQAGKEARLIAERGKIVPASNDGLLFYYTEINPNTTNFTFSANAHVNSWTYSNGQEGFGVMAADTIGAVGDSRTWNNSYQAVVSNVSYKWNGTEISESGESITMKIGVGSTEKVGVTPEDAAALSAGEITAPAAFSAEQTAIDTTFAKYGAGTYNICGNWLAGETGGPAGSSEFEQYVDFYLQIQKNNTGYFVSYTKYVMDENNEYVLDENGNKILDESTTITKKYYTPDALNVLDSDTVYVGVFASRHADITFTDMDLKTIACEDDAEKEERPVTYVNLSKSVLSGSVTNTPEYTLMFASNWYGKVVIKDSSGNILSRHTETDEDGKETEIDYYDVKGTLDKNISTLLDGDNNKDTKVRIELDDLSVGNNVFTLEFTPDKDWTPDIDPDTGKAATKLKSYDTVRFTHTVQFIKYGQEGQSIYVSQDGKASNLGTKDSPLDIYTAVKYVQPGQTILLAGGRYSLTKTLQIPRGVNGKPDIVDGKETYNKYVKMMTDPDAQERAVLDFNGMVAAMVTVGDYWYFKNFDVIRCKDGEKGIQVSGSYCVFDRVDTYRNGSTGLQICRAASTDTYHDWPHDNLILNCNSYLNVDSGYEDADGFAAKLTSGSNNVFDGCISAFNADDGWDLFAKAQTGNIGAVVIKNSIAYRNGYVLKGPDGSILTPDEAAAQGVELTCVMGKGNGNGFKMGGDGMPNGSMYDDDYDPTAAIPYSGHKLINSLSFGNKSKGFDSNNGPNVKIYNSISFNNDGANISLSTYTDTVKNTDYQLENVISFRTDVTGNADGVTQLGAQDPSKVKNATVYYWDATANAAKNANGDTITADDFVSLEYESLNTVDTAYWRNADGTINTHDFLSLKEGVNTGSSEEDIPSMGGTPSIDVTIGEETDGSVSAGNAGETGDDTDDYGEDLPDGGLNVKDENGDPIYFGKIWAAAINYVDYTNKETIAYTGKKIEPEVHVRFSGNAALLTKNKDYKLKFADNLNAGTATVTITGMGNYAGYNNTQTFEILPISVTDNSVSIPSAVAVESGDPASALKPTWLGKALKKDTDYTVTADKEDNSKLVVTGVGNFTGSKTVKAYTASADKLISKASVRITDKSIVYTGDEVKPACEVKLGGSVITDGFTVEYANNIEIGKATLTVVGDGETYFGSKSVSFNIKGGKLENAEVTYRSNGQEIAMAEYVASLNGSMFNGSSSALPVNLISVNINGKKLTNNVDYTIVQKNTDKAGTVSVTIKGINRYTGTQSFKFKVSALDINTLPDDAFVFARTCEYMKGGVEFTAGSSFNIRINGANVSTNQYKLSYKNNTRIASAADAKAPTVTITGTNGLTGKKSFAFTIEKASLDDADITLTVGDMSTGGRSTLTYGYLKNASITLKQSANGKNKKLSAIHDYNGAGIEYYIDMNGNYEIDETDKKIEDDMLKQNVEEFDSSKGWLTVLIRVPAATDDPQCYFKESYVDGYFRVGTFQIRSAKVIQKADRVFGKEYNATSGETSALTFDTVLANFNDYITVTYKDTNTKKTETLTWSSSNDYETHPELLENDGFIIVPNSYKANTKIGTASVQIRGTGKYAGTTRISFKIITKAQADKKAK